MMLLFYMKKLEASLLLSLTMVSGTKFNTKINISWDIGLGDCSLAAEFFWISIPHQEKIRISWIQSSMTDKAHKY